MSKKKKLLTDKSGWFCIAWAFLRPGNLVQSNIDRRVMLQLYEYRNRMQSKFNQSIFSEWKLKKKKFVLYPTEKLHLFYFLYFFEIATDIRHR